MSDGLQRLRGRKPWRAALVLALTFVGAPGAADAAPGDGPTAPEVLPPGIVREGGLYRAEKDGMPLVRVPDGVFHMGSDEGAFDERPQHAVWLGAYLIDRHEVTNAQFERFVRAGVCRPQGPWRRGAGPGLEDHPVRFVTWYDARAYAAWVGRRLPSEAQWEKAARGADARRYPWGSGWDAAAAVTDRPVAEGPLAVGGCPAGDSPYGGQDLAGNVWEWVADWYDRHAYEARGAAPVTRDPLGPPDEAQPEERFRSTGTAGGNERSTRKVVKGGAWCGSGAENTRASKRLALNPRCWLNDTGFRCVLPLSPDAPSDRDGGAPRHP